MSEVRLIKLLSLFLNLNHCFLAHPRFVLLRFFLFCIPIDVDRLSYASHAYECAWFASVHLLQDLHAACESCLSVSRRFTLWLHVDPLLLLFFFLTCLLLLFLFCLLFEESVSSSL